MDTKSNVKRTETYIRQIFRQEGSGHDWFHVDRVRKLAISLGAKEGADLYITEMAALLHDLDDWKLNGSDHEVPEKTIQWLHQLKLPEVIIHQIVTIVSEVSFKGAGVTTPATSIESKVVQDADRLDAIGAIGIARTFAYGGNRNRLIYDPSVKPNVHETFQSYKNSQAPTINHFYEKLLLLKDRMHTHSARNLAEKRHAFMVQFLNQFYAEWELKY